jgi:hypothetical protein
VRKKGVFRRRFQAALKEALTLYQCEQMAARQQGKRSVLNGSLHAIITETENWNALTFGSISSHIVINRALRCNVGGAALQRVSPLKDIEPVIVEYCLRLARNGSPIDKGQLLMLAASLIQGTHSAEQLKEFKRSRGINIDVDRLLGKNGI